MAGGAQGTELRLARQEPLRSASLVRILFSKCSGQLPSLSSSLPNAPIPFHLPSGRARQVAPAVPRRLEGAMAGLARLGVPGGGRAVGGEPLPWAPASLPTALPPLPCRSLPCSACRERGSLRWLGGRRRHPASPRPSPPSPFSPPSGLFQPPPFPAMRRPPRRLTLAVLGVLWIAALLLLFFGARRKPAAAAGPEGRTAEVRGGGVGRG